MPKSVATFALIAISLYLALSSHSTKAATPCAGIAPPSFSDRPTVKRDVQPEDVVGLRDIGPFEATGPLFTISPDGKFAALQLRQADAASNNYCLAMIVIPLSGFRPVVADRGGDLVLADIVGIADLTVGSGIPKVITPQWSADGRWIAFLKKEQGRVQVWKAMADGTGSAPLTNSPLDVARFALTPDGRSLVLATQPETGRLKAAFQREGLSGYHFDDRFIPAADSKPQLPGMLTESIATLDLATGQSRAATDAERGLLHESALMPKPAGYSPNDQHRPQVWIEATGSNFGTPKTVVRYQTSGGDIISCAVGPCSSVRSPSWLSDNGDHAIFLSREGWANGATGIYKWMPGEAEPKRILLTTDYLVDCRPLAKALLCLLEGATEPRRLVSISLLTGKVRTIFDANPEWASLSFGRVRRMNILNSSGLESTADLVYPSHYRKTQRYPAIVVQYVSRGLLRGGVGDEYPILALAAQGYAVLSVNRPPHLGLLANSPDLIAAERINLQNWANRKSILSSIEIPLRQLIAEGLVDSKNIGITGLSDGATTVQYAILHSPMFAAAIMSGCCWERNQGALLGPQIDRTFGQVGYPNLLTPATDFWRQISIAQNARDVQIPILLQTADSEYLGAIETYTALRQANKAIDLFIFPNEFHNKWQPAHRLAIYRRTIRWFNFWLKHETPGSDDFEEEIQHWRGLQRGLLVSDGNDPAGESHIN